MSVSFSSAVTPSCPMVYLWGTIWDGWSRRPALGRLPDELFHSLMARKRDSASASHVIGQAAKHNPALYYTTIECAELTEVHSDIAVRLIGHDNPPDHPGGHVGSRLVAERGMLHRLFPACRDFLADARRQRDFDTFAFHNRYVAITFLTLSLFTAHRPVRAPFQNIQDFDLTAHWLFIDDKEVRESPGRTSTQEALHTPTNRGRGHAEISIRETRFDSKPLGDSARVNAAGYLGYAVQMAAIMSQPISDASTC